MNATVTHMPTPSSKHATCAWCRHDFDTIVELIDHVDNGHLDAAGTAHRHDDRAA
jgi:hypothetical protein